MITLRMLLMQWAWRMHTTGSLKDHDPIAISSIWRLPQQLDVIDAVFERPGDGVVVIFRGKRFWEFQGHELVADFPESGLPLTDLGIESLVERIDAAAVGLGTLNRRTYLFSGYEYWRLREDRMVVDRHYPQEISHVFRGVPPNVDAAFTNLDGSMYFFKDDSYYLFDGNKLDIEDGYPRLINEKWSFCSENLQLLMSAASSSHGAAYSSILVTCLVLMLRLLSSH